MAPFSLDHDQQLRLLDTLLESSRDLVYALDPAGRLAYANSSFLEAVGATSSDALGKTCLELGFDPRAHDLHRREIDRVLQTREATRGETAFRTPARGEFLDFEYTFSPVRDASGQVELIVASMREVTARKRTENALRASERRLRAMLEHMSEGVLLFDPDGNLVYQNPAARRLHGIALMRRASSQEDGEAFRWEVRDRAGRPLAAKDRPLARVLRLSEVRDQLLSLRNRETGEEFFIECHGAAIRDDEGRLNLALLTIRDATAQMRAEEALHKQERRLRAFFQSDMMGAVYWTVDGALTEANDRFLEMVGYSRAELPDVDWTLMTPLEHRAKDEEALRQLLAVGVDIPYAKEFFRKDGGRVPVLVGAAMIDAERHEGVAFVLDITESNRVQQAAEEMRARLDAALLAGEVGTFTWLVSEDRLLGDRNFSRIFGVELQADSSAPLADYIAAIHPEDRAEVMRRIERTLTTGCAYEAEYRIITGERTKWVVVRGVGERDATGRVVRFPGVLMDVTDRKEAEQALRESERQFRELAESMPQLVWITDVAGKAIYFNRRWSAFTGQDHEHLAPLGWLDAVHPDDRAPCLRRWSDSVAGGRPFEAEYRLRARDGSHRWFLARGIALHDESGRVARWFGTTTDIDEHRRVLEALRLSQRELSEARDALALANAELESTVDERTARLRETVQELEHFSYSITHDMRAPLRAMQLFSQILREDHGGQLDEVGASYLKRIDKAAGRMDSLITDSLDYAKAVQTELELGPVDIETLLRGIVESYPQLQYPRAEIVIEPGMPAVRANAAGLTQCVSNLLDNAVKFVAPGVSPRVKIYTERREARARFWFEDNGIGIAPEHRERIFQMFQRLSQNHEGTGVGLPLVRKVARKMRGEAGVEAAPGGGSRFWLELELASGTHA